VGRPVWASPALPGAVHDLTAARTHGIIEATGSPTRSRTVAEQTNSWMNGFGKIRRCTGREQVRLVEGREAQPSAGVLGSQSVKAADTDSRGYDAGKKINGRKRFIVTDTLGLLVRQPPFVIMAQVRG